MGKIIYFVIRLKKKKKEKRIPGLKSTASSWLKAAAGWSSSPRSGKRVWWRPLQSSPLFSTQREESEQKHVPFCTTTNRSQLCFVLFFF